MYNKYLTIGNDIKIVSGGGMCINHDDIPGQSNALLDIKSKDINNTLIRLSYEDSQLEFNTTSNGIILESDM